jgi:hypothetical protein
MICITAWSFGEADDPVYTAGVTPSQPALVLQLTPAATRTDRLWAQTTFTSPYVCRESRARGCSIDAQKDEVQIADWDERLSCWHSQHPER